MSATRKTSLAPTEVDEERDGMSALVPPTRTEDAATRPGRSVRANKKRKVAEEPSVEIPPSQPSLLVEMPLDVLFEIFELLHPTDLVNLARTSRSLRATLIDKSTAPIWKRCRRREKAPNPPRAMSELQWSVLIFNSSCMMCLAKKPKKVMLLMKGRFCGRCTKKNLISRQKLEELFPDADENDLNLISPAAGRGGGYWKPHAEYIMRELASSAALAQCGLPGTIAGLTAALYKQTREIRVMLDRLDDSSARFAQWQHIRLRQIELEEALESEKRYTVIKQRFLDLGYEAADLGLDLAEDLWLTYGFKKGDVTEAEWKRIRKEYEPGILKAKNARLAVRDGAIRATRRLIFEGLYRDYHLTVDPLRWKYMPTLTALFQLDAIREIVESEPDVDVTAESFSSCIQNMPELMSLCADNVKTELLLCIAGSAARSPLPPSVYLMEPVRQLELAAVPLACYACFQLLFGWEGVSSHNCGHAHLPENFFADGNAVEGAMHVVLLAGFCLETTTVAHMDEQDLRFVCQICTPTNKYNRQRKGYFGKAYNWRGMVRHLEAHRCFENTPSKKPDIEIISPELTEVVKANERLVDQERGQDSQWACTHCVAHIPRNPVPHANAVKHVQESHDIIEPQDSVDLVSIRMNQSRLAVEYQAPRPTTRRRTR